MNRVGEPENISVEEPEFSIFSMFSMFSKLTPCSPIRDCRIQQVLQPWPWWLPSPWPDHDHRCPSMSSAQDQKTHPHQSCIFKSLQSWCQQGSFYSKGDYSPCMKIQFCGITLPKYSKFWLNFKLWMIVPLVGGTVSRQSPKSSEYFWHLIYSSLKKQCLTTLDQGNICLTAKSTELPLSRLWVWRPGPLPYPQPTKTNTVAMTMIKTKAVREHPQRALLGS